MKKKINIVKIFSLVLTFLIICITGFNLKVNAGYSGDGGYPGDYYIEIYTNDGSTLLEDSAMTVGVYHVVNNLGLYLQNTQVYQYEGNLKFKGFSTVKNSNEITYAIGDTIITTIPWETIKLYIVEEGINKLISLEGATVRVPAGWSASNVGNGCFSIIGNVEYNNSSYSFSQCGIGYNLGVDTLQNNVVSFATSIGTKIINDTNVSFRLFNLSGSDVTNPDLIQWFVDNGATIDGGVYADDVVSVTNDIGDSKLVWELKWTETTEENVNDYVAIYPSSDTKQCYISFKKSFSIPMELLVKIEGDETVYASCDVDCYERTETITDTSLSVSIDGSTNFDLLLGQDVEENEITFNGNTTFESIFENQKVELNSMTCVPVTKGTLGTTQEISYKIGLSEELQSLLESRNITFISSTSSLITTTVKGLLESLITFNADNKEIIYEALNTTENWFRIDVEIVDKYHDEIINEYLYIINIIGFMIDDYYSTTIIPTDLTGYTVTVPAGWSAFEYGVFSELGFTLFDNSNNIELGIYSGIAIGYAYSSNIGNPFSSEDYICLDTGDRDSFSAGNYDNSYSFKFSNISGTDTTNQNLIKWFVDKGATFTKIEEEPETPAILISFHISGMRFLAEEGMTWSEWVNSSYNTMGFMIVGNGLISNGASTIAGVVSSDAIIKNKEYTFDTSGF